MRALFKPYEWRLARIRILFTFVIVCLLTASILLVFSTEREVVWAETTRVGTDKQVVALAGAQRIKSFFERVEADLRILSQASVSGELDRQELRRLLGITVDRYEGTPLVSLARIDREGKVVLAACRERLMVSEGADLSDKSYFIWASQQKDDNGVFLSEPMIARGGPAEGQWGLVIAVPSFQNGEFNGAMLASVVLDKLIEEYVESLAVYEGSGVILLDKTGAVLYCGCGGDSLGKNISEFLVAEDSREEKLYGGYVDEILNGHNSWVELDMRFSLEDRLQPWIVGFASMDFGGDRWVLLSMVTNKEAFGRIEKYQRIAYLGLLMAGLSATIIGMLWILSVRKTQQVWYKRGYEIAQDLRKKAMKIKVVDGKKPK
jgi:hypothetical protein